MVNKERHIVLVGLVENKPYEIFVTNDPETKIDLDKHKRGYLAKVRKGQYDLQVVNGEEKTILENISNVFDQEYGTLSRFISMSLRHEVPIPFIVDQLAKDKSFISFEKAVSRILKKYIVEGELVVTSEVCPHCGENLVYQSGCKTCINPECAWSKCD
jgi:ribonucleoside-diphosphate reductase alpha chain